MVADQSATSVHVQRGSPASPSLVPWAASPCAINSRPADTVAKPTTIRLSIHIQWLLHTAGSPYKATATIAAHWPGAHPTVSRDDVLRLQRHRRLPKFCIPASPELRFHRGPDGSRSCRATEGSRMASATCHCSARDQAATRIAEDLRPQLPPGSVNPALQSTHRAACRIRHLLIASLFNPNQMKGFFLFLR